MSAIEQQKILGQFEGENRKEKIELILRKTAEGTATLEVRSMRWGQGIGWYVQKTIVLGPTQVRTLARVLRQVSVMGAEPTERGKVIPFPGAERS